MEDKKKTKKNAYEKPQLKKNGNLKDITARSSGIGPAAPVKPS